VGDKVPWKKTLYFFRLERIAIGLRSLRRDPVLSERMESDEPKPSAYQTAIPWSAGAIVKKAYAPQFSRVPSWFAN
jgi:hypothetical protein